MNKSLRKGDTSNMKSNKDVISKEETQSLSKVTKDEKSKNISSVISKTPRNYAQKSTPADVYGQKKTSSVVANAPRKSLGSSASTKYVSPMKGLLKSSPSSKSVSEQSRDNRKSVTSKPSLLSVRQSTLKDSGLVKTRSSTETTKKTSRTTKVSSTVNNVTVNSPIVKRKLEYGSSNEDALSEKYVASDRVANRSKNERGNPKGIGTRQRTKTRTLDEDEVKILTPAVVDNNVEMLKLSKKLSAEPKSFYVDLELESSKPAVVSRKQNKSSDEEAEVSYEDDFESYESDFESYHSESHSNGDSIEQDEGQIEGDEHKGETMLSKTKFTEEGTSSLKEIRDEEKMLDSGNFELREQRSAQRKGNVMDFIQEDTEDLNSDKKISLTDEGFQEMSNSSAVSSMRTVHIDILDKPLFIDFTKSKENRRKRKIFERVKQRAKDILSMVTLHKMSFTLFEMKPIPYDIYMATFGRSNYTQTAVQTFEDGVNEEVQTEEVLHENKWTQHPVDFSKHDVYLYDTNLKKYTQGSDDYLPEFKYLWRDKSDEDKNSANNLDLNYKNNSLRIYFEQKNGVGAAKMLPYEEYKTKIENKNFNAMKLKKFLKRVESRLSHVLCVNVGTKMFTDLITSTKLPFSKGYTTISLKNTSNDSLTCLKNAKVYKIIFSETKSNLVMTVHEKTPDTLASEKSIICLWDLSVASNDPLKLLVAIDNITVARFKGNTDGIFVAALEDSSLHLWDLSEEPTWRDDVTRNEKEKTTSLLEINLQSLSQTERDREWNVKNSKAFKPLPLPHSPLQVSAYTSSAVNMDTRIIDNTIGLELVHNVTGYQCGGRRIIGQVCSLQCIGLLIIWNIIQEKPKTSTADIGKAFWSKMKLEKCQNINLADYIDVPVENSLQNKDSIPSFNLNAAKKRLLNRKQEKRLIKRTHSTRARPKSAMSDSEFEFDRPSSAASMKRLPDENNLSNWENGIICNDLKIIKINKSINYLIAKNCGEVLSCTKTAGAVKVIPYSVTNDTSSVTCVKVSPHGLPYFLASTDTGTVHLYSMLDARVLLTLDCRNGPPTTSELMDKYECDHKGRFISSTPKRDTDINASHIGGGKLSIASVVWSKSNPCDVMVLTHSGDVYAWRFTHSDINAAFVCSKAAVAWSSADNNLAIVTPDGEVQIHRLTHERQSTHYLELFQKYVTLL